MTATDEGPLPEGTQFIFGAGRGRDQLWYVTLKVRGPDGHLIGEAYLDKPFKDFDEVLRKLNALEATLAKNLRAAGISIETMEVV